MRLIIYGHQNSLSMIFPVTRTVADILINHAFEIALRLAEHARGSTDRTFLVLIGAFEVIERLKIGPCLIGKRTFLWQQVGTVQVLL